MSDNIFAEIYNKILSLFGQNTKDESKNTAVNRLRLVLMQDRTNLTPEIMNRMRTELIAVLSKYVELDKEALDLNIGQEGEQMALMLSIPVIRAKDEAEIEQAIKEEEEAKKAKEETEEEEVKEEEKPEDSSEKEDKEEKEENQNDEDSDEELTEKDSSEISEEEESEEQTSEPEEKTTQKPEQKAIPKLEKHKDNNEEDKTSEE